MRHPTDGTLRRLLDEPAGVADADREHVAGCPVCLSGLAAAQQDAAADRRGAGRRRSPRTWTRGGRRLSHAVAVDGRRRLRRGRAAPAGGGPRCAARWSPRSASSPCWPGPVPRPPRTGCRSSAPSRSPRSRSPRPTWSSCPTSPPTASVEVTEEADVREVADAAAAEEATGLAVPRVGELPRGVTGEPTYQVGGQVSAVFTFSAEKAAQAAAAAGETLPPPPAGPRRQPVPADRRPRARRGLVGGPRRAGADRGPRGRAHRVLLGRPVRDRPRLPAVPARPARGRRGAAAQLLRRRDDAAAARAGRGR